jgi:hypothetical protein
MKIEMKNQGYDFKNEMIQSIDQIKTSVVELKDLLTNKRAKKLII